MKNFTSKSIILLFVLGLGSPTVVDAQSGHIKSKVRESMEEKHAEPQREKGREAIRGVSYENDTRFSDAKNRVEATIDIQLTSFKKNGKVKDETTTKVVFGPLGECMANNVNTADESRIIFNYADAANYIVNVKDKTAMKMPLVNIGKMVSRMAQAMPEAEEPDGSWEKTSEVETINGFKSRKHIYTDNDGTSMIIWATNDITIDLSDNYLFGTQIKDYAVDLEGKSNDDPNIPRGMAVRTISLDKNGTQVSQMDIKQFEKSYDADFFDLSKYRVNDIIDKL